MTSQHTTQTKTSENDRTSQATVKAKPASPTALHPMLHLQRQVGNQAVGRLIQAKLTVGEANDVYEQEADRVAAEVVRQIHAPKPPSMGQTTSVQRQMVGDEEEKLQTKTLIQCKSDVGGMAVSSEVESSIQQARGSGQPLAESIRAPMEQAFGADFSGVRVHTDDRSDRLNRSVEARAFTTGQDVFFRQGEYSPGSRGGQELLAHELTHVVQQSSKTAQQCQRILRAETADKFKMATMPDRIIQRMPVSVSGMFTKDVAIKIFKNYYKGNAPFKPEYGEHGNCSWFLVNGNPYTGVDESRNIKIEAIVDDSNIEHMGNNFLLTTLNSIKTKFPNEEKKSQQRKAWDSVGESVRNTSRTGVCLLPVPQSEMSASGSGSFLVVAPQGRHLVQLSNVNALKQALGNEEVNNITTDVQKKEASRIAEVTFAFAQDKTVYTKLEMINKLKQAGVKPPADSQFVMGQSLNTTSWAALVQTTFISSKIKLIYNSYREARDAARNFRLKYPNGDIFIKANAQWPAKELDRLSAKKVSS